MTVLEYFFSIQDDIQFSIFLKRATDLRQSDIDVIFDIFDLDRSGSVEFDEVSGMILQ